MSDALELLVRMYEEQRTHARHHEEQRSAVTNFLITITVAILALVGHLQSEVTAMPLAVFLVFVGVYGGLVSLKLYERNRFHARRASGYRDELDRLCPDARIVEIKHAAAAKHRMRCPRLHGVRLHKLWIALHGFITVLGLTCIVVIIAKSLSS